MKKINIKLVQSNYLWFEAFHPNHPEVINSDHDPENPMVDFCGNFDYEFLPTGIRHVYIDIELKMIPVGAILVRSDFEFKCKEFLWDYIFTVDIIHPMVSLAIKKCITAFEEQCELLQITMPYSIPFTDEVVSAIGKVIIAQYFDYRKPHDIENAYLMSNIGLECKQSNNTFITIQGTFLIIDELIYNNPRFDRKHNLKVLTGFVPEPRYLTLKMNCIQIIDHPVKLTFYDAILFYTCVDCAMQMLLSDKSDLMISALEAKGMTKEIRSTFFKHGTNLFNVIRKVLLRPNVRIINLEEKHDWDKLLR